MLYCVVVATALAFHAFVHVNSTDERAVRHHRTTS